MFTNKRNWYFNKPLKVDSAKIEVHKSATFLGITLDSILSWTEHIENECKNSKGVLMQCRRAIGV